MSQNALFLQVIAVNSFGSAQFCLCSRHGVCPSSTVWSVWEVFEVQILSLELCKKWCVKKIFGSKAGIADGRVLIPLECSGCSAATAAYLVPCHNDVDVVFFCVAEVLEVFLFTKVLKHGLRVLNIESLWKLIKKVSYFCDFCRFFTPAQRRRTARREPSTSSPAPPAMLPSGHSKMPNVQVVVCLVDVKM